MKSADRILAWIKSEHLNMVSLVEKWANINSGSNNIEGLCALCQILQEDFSILGGFAEVIPLPPRKQLSPQGFFTEVPAAPALRITKRPEAPVQIFFGGHMDTVFSPSSPFQQTTRVDANTLKGPGVADLKGGLAILLKGLEAFEKFPDAASIGWEIVLNPDEEIGSPSSDNLFIEGAKRNDFGIIFEPSYPDGAFVHKRKGSSNFAVIAKGYASHAGRDFHRGKSAIYAIADFITQIESLNDNFQGITVNVGEIRGGGPVNIVPDFALCRFNVRMTTSEQLSFIQNQLQKIIDLCHKRDGITLTLIQEYVCPPKQFDAKTEAFFKAYQGCAMELGLPFQLRESGGVCDGNRLASAGLPTLDTAGAVGGNMHTVEEYINLNSLVERAQLLALFLMKLSQGK